MLRARMRDQPAPPLEPVRAIVDQLARGLDAFHRREMVHGDLRPENVMLDPAGTARIIDFGSVRVAGISPNCRSATTAPSAPPNTALPSACSALPATSASDIYALAALTYHRADRPPALRCAAPPGCAARATCAACATAPRASFAPTSRPGSMPPYPAPWIRPPNRTPFATDFAHALRHPDPNPDPGPPLDAIPSAFGKPSRSRSPSRSPSSPPPDSGSARPQYVL